MAYTLTDTQILFGATELSGVTASFDQSAETVMEPVDNLGALGWHCVIPGLSTGTGTAKGYADFATGAVSAVWGPTQLGKQVAYSIVANGSTAQPGSPASSMRGRVDKMKLHQAAVGKVAAFDYNVVGDSAEFDGLLAAPLALRSTPLTGTSIQQGAVPAGSAMWAALHVISGTFTNLVVTVQTDNATGFPSPAVGISFLSMSAPGWQFLTVPGPLTDDWVRAVSTIGSGSAQFAVIVGID